MVDVRPAEQGGAPCIIPLGYAEARSRFEEGVRFVRPARDGEPSPAILAEDIARAILGSSKRELLPKLNSIVNQPFLVEASGQLSLLRPGYNEGCGIMVLAQTEIPTIDLAEAVATLSDTLLGEFRFTKPSDKARAVAALIAPALVVGGLLPERSAINVIEADHSQTGKGFLVKVIATVYGETPTCLTKQTGGVGSLEESLNQALIWGRPFISIENVRGSIDSQKLESFLTEPTYLARVPHQAGMMIDPRRFVLFLTSNGAEFTQDLANRASFIRLRKRANHNFRAFAEGGLLDHISANRPLLLGSVFAVVRHWHAAGRPRTTDVRHSFRAWAQICDWIVQNVFSLPPLLDDHAELTDRAVLPSLSLLRKLAIQVEKIRRLGETLRATDLFGIAAEGCIEIPTPRGLELDVERGARQIGMLAARVFQDRDSVTVDEYTITRIEVPPDELMHHPGKAYIFSKAVDQDGSQGHQDGTQGDQQHPG